MIQFPIPLKAMVFLKRLWGELWQNEETPNIPYPSHMVHSCKRDVVFDVQVLFLDAFGIGENLPLYRWQDLEAERSKIYTRYLTEKYAPAAVDNSNVEVTVEFQGIDEELPEGASLEDVERLAKQNEPYYERDVNGKAHIKNAKIKTAKDFLKGDRE